MPIPTLRPMAYRAALLGGLLLAPSLAVGAVEPPAQPTAQPAAAAPAAAEPGSQPPDGVWLKGEDGREYYVERLEKASAGPFRRIDDKTIRTVWGIVIQLEKEDDQALYYRVYRQTASDAPVLIKESEPSAEQLESAAKTYSSVGESAKLEAVSFGRGLPEGGQWRHGFDVADMDEDGQLDIIHAAARKTLTPPVVFLGDGKGSWRRWSGSKYPDLAYDYGYVAVGDLNGDKHLDMVMGVHLRGLIALVGDGKGNFKDWSKGLDFVVAKSGVVPGFSSRAVALADWNRDGRLDIVALGEGPRLNIDRGRAAENDASGIVVYLNQGDGSWVRKDQGTGSDKQFGDTIEVADIDGDGQVDVVSPSNIYGRKDIVHYGKKDGTWQSINIPAVRPAGYVRGIAVADFDGDGRRDLGVGYINRELGIWRSGIDVLLAQPDGTWRRNPVWAVDGRISVTALAAGDLDGDGKVDLVGLSGKGDTWVFLGDGHGGFTRDAKEIPQLTDCQGYHAEIVDLDRDGRGELIASFGGESSALFAPGVCPSGGAIQAWKFQPAAAATAP